MRYFALLLSLLLILLPVSAQDEDLVTIDLSGAFDITVPESWEVDQQNGTGYFWETDDSRIRIRGYSNFFLGFRDLEGIDELMDFLVIEVFENREFEDDLLEERTFGDYDGLVYTYEQNNQGNRFERIIMMFENETGFIFTGYISPLEGETNNSDDVEAMVQALETITLRDEYVFYDNTVFPIPDDWFVVEDVNYGIAVAAVSNGDIVLDIGFWPRYGEIVGFEEDRDFLGYIFDNNWDNIGRYDRTLAEDITVAGFDGIYYDFDTETLNSLGLYTIGVIIFSVEPSNTYITGTVMATEPDVDLDVAYDMLDEIQPGNISVCPLFSDPGDRIRSRATVNSDIVRETGDETLIAVAQTIGDDGYVWFDIREGWIRQDIIFYEVNTCADIPER